MNHEYEDEEEIEFDDVYNDTDNMLENEAINANEAGFMNGYLNNEEIEEEEGEDE